MSNINRPSPGIGSGGANSTARLRRAAQAGSMQELQLGNGLVFDRHGRLTIDELSIRGGAIGPRGEQGPGGLAGPQGPPGDPGAAQEGQEVWTEATVSVNEHFFGCDSSAQFRYASPSILGSYVFVLPEGTSRITRMYIRFERGVIAEDTVSNDDSDIFILWFPMWKTEDDLKIYNTTPGYRTILPEQVAWATNDPYATWYAHPRLGEAIITFFDEQGQTFSHKDEHIALGSLNVSTTGTYGLHKVDLVGATVAQTAHGEGGEHFRVNGTFYISYACR